jgi:hypothetical protein
MLALHDPSDSAPPLVGGAFLSAVNHHGAKGRGGFRSKEWNLFLLIRHQIFRSIERQHREDHGGDGAEPMSYVPRDRSDFTTLAYRKPTKLSPRACLVLIAGTSLLLWLAVVTVIRVIL